METHAVKILVKFAVAAVLTGAGSTIGKKAGKELKEMLK